MVNNSNKTLSEIIRSEYELRFNNRPLDDWHRDQIADYLKKGFLTGAKNKMSIHFDRVVETQEGVENDMLTFLMNYYVSTKEYLIQEGFFVEEYEYNNKDYASLCVRLYDKNMTKQERQDYEQKSQMSEMRRELSSLERERRFIKNNLKIFHNRQKSLKGQIWYLRGAIKKFEKFVSDNNVVVHEDNENVLNNRRRNTDLCFNLGELDTNKRKIIEMNNRLYEVEDKIKSLNRDYTFALRGYERIDFDKDDKDETEDYICGCNLKSYLGDVD